MSYFISAPDALAEYGVGPAQLLAVIEHDLVVIYDNDKYEIGRHEAFRAWITKLQDEKIQGINKAEYQSQRLAYPATRAQEISRNLRGKSTGRVVDDFYSERRDAVKEQYIPERLLRVKNLLFFVRRDVELAFSQLFPEIFAYYQQNQKPVSSDHLPVTTLELESSPKSNCPSITVPEELRIIPKITVAAWNTAIQQYEEHHAKRKNDALPKRMRIYLRYVSGESFSSIETDHPNLSRTLTLAREKDIPTLKGVFPDLPELPIFQK
ncbi:hypothetical protein LJC36_04675 [Desulfovibrio sp. OttesenSCG-928-C14]|nr:hypothetical protein [Desulfovibrio sp. OttesenSCG-928-C14]